MGPIPLACRRAERTDTVRLTDAHLGTRLLLRDLPPDPRAELQIRSLGLVPGVEVRVLRRAPFHGPLLIEVERRTVAVGWRVASGIEVVTAASAAEDA
jgi:Fe2+ transport system protein FeoA